MKCRKFSFVRFLDINRSNINYELHLHTTRTDSRVDIETALRTASARGLVGIAFTEHVRKDTAWFDDFIREVRCNASNFPQLITLVGCEAKALDAYGTLDINPAILAECDIVLGSVHRFPDSKGGFLDFAALNAKEVAQIEFELALGLVESAPIDVLSHPGGMYSRQYAEDLPNTMLRAIMIKTLSRGIAIEINSSYIKSFPDFLALCAEINPYVSIGSDVHHIEDIGQCRDRLLTCGVGIK